MRIKHALTMTAAIAALGATSAAAEVVVEKAVVGDAIVILEVRTNPSSAIHSGALTYDDLVLVEKVALALEADKQLARPGITATLSAKDGRVSLSGSAESQAQAYRAERIAKLAAAPNGVTGFLSPTGG